jgi:outer membrane receptor for ferrienterochelin and colicin
VKYAVFGSVGIPFFQNRLNASLGLRLDANSYSMEMSNLFKQFSPRLALSYRLSEPFFVNVNVGRYYQLPAYTTLGYRDAQGTLVNKKNGVKYTYADHYVAGMEYRPNNYTKITLEGFYKGYGDYPFSVKDSVSIASKGGDFGVVGDEEVTANSRGRAYGFELMARQRSPKGFSFIAAYTFVRSEFTDINNKFIPSSWDSRHLFTTTMNKTFKKNWEIGVKWRYLGGLPYTPVDEDKTTLKQAWDIRGREYYDFSRFNQSRLEAFHQLDLRIDKAYTFQNWSLGIYFDIQNLYNNKIKEPVKYVQKLDENSNPLILNPTDPVSLQRYDFNKIYTESGTVLPTLGVIVEF